MRATTSLALRLANNDVTFLVGAEGGGISAEVQSVQSGAEHFPRKHLGPLEYEDFSVQIAPAMANGLFEWIAASWSPLAPKQDGAILGLDYKLDIKSEREFFGALIEETTIPALDAASKDPAYLTVRFTPEGIALKPGSGKLPLTKGAKYKLWHTANFQLKIAGLDCTKVSRIQSFTVKRAIISTVDGTSGLKQLAAGKVDFPNLRISLAHVSGQSWYDWHDDFVVKGNNDDSFEREGSISFLSPNLKAELVRIELHHLGIVRLETEQAKGSQIGRLVAELYCEQMVLIPGKGGL